MAKMSVIEICLTLRAPDVTSAQRFPATLEGEWLPSSRHRLSFCLHSANRVVQRKPMKHPLKSNVTASFASASTSTNATQVQEPIQSKTCVDAQSYVRSYKRRDRIDSSAGVSLPKEGNETTLSGYFTMRQLWLQCVAPAIMFADDVRCSAITQVQCVPEYSQFPSQKIPALFL